MDIRGLPNLLKIEKSSGGSFASKFQLQLRTH